MRFKIGLMAAAAAAAFLAGCGGGGDDPPPARATIVTAQLAGQATKAQIDAGTAASGLQPLSGAAQCDVDIRYVLYMTRDPLGAPATASTAVFVPSGSTPACSGNRPVVLYAHGTTTAKSYNIADVSRSAANPAQYNNAAGAEGSLVMAMYAAQGFIVVAPNYLGYDRSSLAYHPYLNAEAQAVDMVDGLRAAKAHLATTSGSQASSALFVTGYSQGGHVAIATQRALQRDHAGEFTVTAAAGMSGPYNLVGFGDIVTGPGPVNAGATIFVPMLLTSYQKSYGNIYATTSDAYQAPFDAGAETLFPTDTPIATLIAQQRLPNDPTFTRLFGAGGLLTDSFRAGYATSNYRTALQNNTLLTFTPTRPTVFCGGQADPTVYYQVNTTAMQSALVAHDVAVPAFDLENRATLPAGTLGDQIYGGFQAQKTAAGANAQALYHGSLVPPFCNALVRGFFQQVLASGL